MSHDWLRDRETNMTADEHWDELLNDFNELLYALKEIAKTEGPYSRDPLTHAENVIENMASIANKAIAKHEVSE